MVSNGVIYARVMEKLHFEPNIDESNITVSVKNNGVVVLGGSVKSYTEKYLAEEAIEKIAKVKGIANELEVKLEPTYKRRDADIVQAALNALKWNMFIPYEKIKVIVESGRLTLTGEVFHHHQKERAQKVVQDLYGVTYVINNLKVVPPIPPRDVKNKIIREFERNGRIDANNIQVNIDGNEVRLKGKVRNFDEIREAKNAAWSIPGVIKVTSYLVIA